MFATVRILAVPLAAAEVVSTSFPAGFRPWAWLTVAALAGGGAALAWLTLLPASPAVRDRLAALALAFDVAIVFAFVFVFSFLDGQPLWSLYYLPILEAALRFGLLGGLVTPLATAPLLYGVEVWRSRRFEPFHVRTDVVLVRAALGLLIGAVAGRLVTALLAEEERTRLRAAEAEQLRDELARRVDVLEATNRCARALASSLDVDQAFGAFIRELRGLVPSDRVSIVLVEGGMARVLVTAGVGADTVFPPGALRPIEGSALEEVLKGDTVHRHDISEPLYPEEADLAGLDLRSRLVTPLQAGARTIGMLAVQRREPGGFTEEEVELTELLGRLVATTVQNLRAYEAERSTVEELRRLSALRADFVSLVSHELRSPMAAVIGSARTLQSRWRELTPEQRESFLALIGDETDRLARLIGDVLDTSRIEAGTFSFSFGDVDLAELVRDVVAAAGIAQDEVRVRASVPPALPSVRGDRERLQQVLTNLIDNAVKYSPAGGEVRVDTASSNGKVRVEVADSGPGIPLDQQGTIFEKFGRAGDRSKPGSGLGLFIARSIAEAHGGTLDVRSRPEQGATFVLTLPT